MADSIVTGKAFEDVNGIQWSVSDNMVHMRLQYNELRGITLNMTPYMVRHVIQNLEIAEKNLLANQGAGEGNGIGRIINLHAGIKVRTAAEALKSGRRK